MLHTRVNRAFRSVFRFVSDTFSDNFCIVCTQTAFFIKKQKALGGFQIIFHLVFASFVPDLSVHVGEGGDGEEKVISRKRRWNEKQHKLYSHPTAVGQKHQIHEQHSYH